MAKIILPIITLILFAIILVITYIFKKGDSFSIRNHYPFEVSSNFDYKSRITYMFLFATFITCAALSYTLIFTDLSSFMGKIIAVVWGLSMIFFLIINFVDLSYCKLHLSFAIAYFILSIGGSALTVCVSFFGGGRFQFNKVIAIIMAVIGLGLLVILFVPKLKNWMYLEKSEEDGKTIYVRPKYSLLAFYEWIYLFAHMAFMVLICVSAIIDYIG